jgi:(4S)-4-hydroxy-5-phosphonooxypentane-2,3-dione isomerase
MFVVLVTIDIKPERVQEFIEATRLNHEGSVQEPGCARFDVIQSADDGTKFFLYEVYKTPEDFDAHKQTAHFARWRDTVEDLMAVPRTRVLCNSLYPEPWQ